MKESNKVFDELVENEEIPKSEEEALQTIEIIAIEKERIEREKRDALTQLDVQLQSFQSPSIISEREMPVTYSEANVDLNKTKGVPRQAEKNAKNLGRPSEERDENLEVQSDNDDSIIDWDYKEPEEHFISDKVYEFDEKKHGVRSGQLIFLLKTIPNKICG